MLALFRCARRRPAEALALAVCLAVGGYVIVGPMLAARYPMMQDLPFHAANASILLHYLDPSYHFREQFVLQPFAVPYVTFYLLAALCMLVVDAVAAVKVASVVMLALLPLGLAVLCHGMRKSPLLGLSGLGLAWCGLSSWGFMNFLGALGLFATSVGLALRIVDRPRAATRLWLGVVLLLLFFTHPFRFPFAICAVVGVGVVMFPATRRLRPLILPVVAPLVVFAAWWSVRPPSLVGDMALSLDTSRFAQIEPLVFGTLFSPEEHVLVERGVRWLGVLAAALLLASIPRLWRHSRRRWRWIAGSHLVVACCAGAFLLMYLTLPLSIGEWWYVYPREATAACYAALGLMPDLPRRGFAKLLWTALVAWPLLSLGALQIEAHRQWDALTDDFQRIQREVPAAPKLLYLIYQRGDSPSRRDPVLHLPAYIQADRGGWLSFHFAVWGASPIVYRSPRDPDAVVPPPVPRRWEWTPEKFDVHTHAPFFDWFLIRSRRDPASRLAGDPSIVLHAHIGSWWLFRRRHDAAD